MKYGLAIIAIMSSLNLYSLNDANRQTTIKNLCSLQSTINLAVGLSFTSARTEFQAMPLPAIFAGFFKSFWRLPSTSLLDWVSPMSADNAGARKFRETWQNVSETTLIEAWIFALENYRAPKDLHENVMDIFDASFAEIHGLILSKCHPGTYSYTKAPKGAQLFYRQELRRLLEEGDLLKDSQIEDALAHLLNEEGQTIHEEYRRLSQQKVPGIPFDHRAKALVMLRAEKQAAISKPAK